ncbi:hypothetical protein R1D02_24470, partial [Escherichia coli]
TCLNFPIKKTETIGNYMEADKYIMIIKYLSDNSHKLTPLVLAVSVLVAFLSILFIAMRMG